MSKRHNDQLEPTRISQHGGACGSWSTVGIAIRWTRRRAAAGDDEDQIGPDTRHLSWRRSTSLRNSCEVRDSPTCNTSSSNLTSIYKALAAGEVDISMAFAPPFVMQIDAGEPIVLLGGVHAGCFELFGTDRVRAIRDLKGKTVAIPALGSPHHVFLGSSWPRTSASIPVKTSTG